MLSVVVDDVEDIVVACDGDNRIVFANGAAERLLGIAAIQLSGRRWSELCIVQEPDGTPIRSDQSLLGAVAANDPVRDRELHLVLANGDRRVVIARGHSVAGGDGRCASVVSLHDITERRRLEAELADAAHIDPLTRIANRSLFLVHARRSLEQARQQAWSTAILSMDIDSFSRINGDLGHANADHVLVEVARSLEGALRRDDSIGCAGGRLARVGADEFLVLCDGVRDQGDAVAIAARLAAAVTAPIRIADGEISVTVSIGIAMSRSGYTNADALITEASSAMRRARLSGPGRCEVYAESIRIEDAGKAADQRALRRALDDGEFGLVCQPKVSLVTGRIVGVEALLRWYRCGCEAAPPSEFIPLAEETGLIVPIGRWVLEEACRQASRWESSLPDAPPLVTSVNVSARQFEADLVDTVRGVLVRTGLDPARLCLEVTESTVMRDVDSAIATLRAIKALGVAISVDDFGTGYSSLAYLKRFPLDEVKVDKSFIDGLGGDPDATAIVAAIIATAHALNLTVVAEGVETAAQLECLRTLGCEQVQGFHYFHPEPAASVEYRLVDQATGGGSPAASRGAPPGGDRGGGREVAVVVDDAADVRQLARVSLAAAGFAVHEAEDGETALHLTRTLRPTCVLLDVHLEGMSGLETCRRLREDARTRDVTIVMLTSETGASEKAEAFSLEADEYIVKPFAPRELVSRVHAAMRRRREAARTAAGRGPAR